MDELTSAQPVEYLERLLECLTSPVQPQGSLEAVRDLGGRIVALRSAEGDYPVVNNIPQMLPQLREGATGDEAQWRAHQQGMWREYQDGEEGVFTREDHELAQVVGRIIAEEGAGLCLDAGCGARPCPPYMSHSGIKVEWIGIDPFFGDARRQFPFVQALAEYLPFRPETFDGALYASTIYHVLNPLRALRRMRSALKPQGKLFVWYLRARTDARYLAWRGARALGLARRYSGNYQWAFSAISMRRLLEQAGFEVDRTVFLCEFCPGFSECDDPAEHLVVAGCARTRS